MSAKSFPVVGESSDCIDCSGNQEIGWTPIRLPHWLRVKRFDDILWRLRLTAPRREANPQDALTHPK